MDGRILESQEGIHGFRFRISSAADHTASRTTRARGIRHVSVVPHGQHDGDGCGGQRRRRLALCAMWPAVGRQPAVRRRGLCLLGVRAHRFAGRSVIHVTRWRLSIAADVANADGAAERWREWQRRYAESSRKSAKRARIVFTILFMVVGAWLGLELLSLPLPF